MATGARRGVLAVLLATGREFTGDNIALISAGIAFHVLLAIFPALAAFVILYGMLADVGHAARQLQLLAFVLPHAEAVYVREQVAQIARARPGRLTVAVVAGLIVAIWSASGATRALLLGLNIAYEERERRGFIAMSLVSLAFTAGWLALLIVTVVALAAAPAIAPLAGPYMRLALHVLRWPFLILAFVGSVSVLYRFGPSRQKGGYRWISGGAAAATVLWAVMSAAFSVFLGQFAHYERTYGSLSALIGLMIWTWLSAMIILAGAELNCELERT